jgi:uracil-DNA glycosylase family 4
MLLPKPESCKGCPLYQDGTGFVPDALNDEAEVFVVAQNPGANEEAGLKWNGTLYEPHPQEPLIGKTGHYMDSAFLPVAGLNRSQISVGNALRCRWRNADDLPLLRQPLARKALEHCHSAHFKLPPKTKVIVATGEYAMHALTQYGLEKFNSLSDWRGYVLPFEPVGVPRTFRNSIWQPSSGGVAVLATYHLAYLFRDPTAILVSKLDWSKIPKLLKGTWPRKLPEIVMAPPEVWPVESAFDTEYNPENRHFLCYSLYDGKRLHVSEKLEPGVLLDRPTNVIMHNAPADIEFLERMGIKYQYEDTMHAHAVLWSDLPHDLGFLGSLYAPINRWKHLMRINPVTYSAADAYGTWHVWKALEAELERDVFSKQLYHNIQKRLIPIIMRAESRGVRVNPDKARAAFEKRQVIIDALDLEAQAMVGWPINLRSNDQVKQQLFEIEGLLKMVER